MINSYPFFEYADKTLDYALFKANDGVLDKVTGLTYTKFDVQLDAVYSAMEEIGYGDVDIVVAEIGWASKGDPNQPDANKNYALSYNANLV
ncbi:glucan endo-1 [Quercus suber]|uniref:glucan endo-1,3-beta-D-glucosidase n=1 Tax=Quercus suber TaxID=58331 RepID=A0AAW0KRQ3_QUESU|nr:glucan endo-1,3-beta-glucosidase-like [Quercus suber]POE60353.1 glucan endo-1,3-beta-glucosidase [Quercus suber]